MQDCGGYHWYIWQRKDKQSQAGQLVGVVVVRRCRVLEAQDEEILGDVQFKAGCTAAAGVA